MPERSFSKSEIDRLGVRLKRGAPTDADLTVLDAYRGTFAAAYAFVVTALRRRLRVKATGRPAKSTTSVIDKLQRETIRLSQMQDIAGCRIVVRNIVTQNKLLARIQALFPGCTTVDRREHPSHPYRAVHVIVYFEDRPIEIQIRSGLQHMWSEVAERPSPSIGGGLKYGRGPADLQMLLFGAAQPVSVFAAEEMRY